MVKRDAHLKIQKFGDSYSGVRLYGDTDRPETDQFGIKFPGGEIYVQRTSKGDYWAHIVVEKDPLKDEWNGEIVSERKDTYSHPTWGEKVYHIAALIKAYLPIN